MNLTLFKQVSTKGMTEVLGSHTVYFSPEHVFTFNGTMGLLSDNPYKITGSVNTHNFVQLMAKIENPNISEKDEFVIISYNKKNVAKLRKESDGLKAYQIMVFPAITDRKPLPANFIEALSIVKFQNHRNALSGVYIDYDMAYVVNQSDIAYYKIETFGENFWLPREAVELILSVSDPIEEYTLSDSFLYLYTADCTLAVKLKYINNYPIKLITDLMKDKKSFPPALVINGILNALNRVKICTIVNTEQKQVMQMKFGDGVVTVSSLGTMDYIEEQLEYDGSLQSTVIVAIDAFITLYKERMNLSFIEAKEGLFFVSSDQNSAYLMKVSTKE